MARSRRTTVAEKPSNKAAKKPTPKKAVTKKRATKPAAIKPAAKKPTKPATRKPRARPTSPEGPTQSRERLPAALAAIAPRLAADPIYAHASNAPFDAPELERYFATAEGVTLGHLFAEILQGMIQSVRYSALHVVRELYRDDKLASITTKPALEIPQGGTLAVVGDLVVEGDLDNEGVLVVTGDLTVRGAYVGPAFDYSLAVVGGTMRARDVSSSGEILVGERLEATRIVHLVYNDYSSVLPAVKARALVIDDNFPALGSIDAEIQIKGRPDDDQLRAMFGAAADKLADDDESPIRTLIRS